MRLTPLPFDEWDADVRGALAVLLPSERINPRDVGNVLATLIRNPALTQAYLQFNKYVLADSTLSARAREIAVLRAVQLRDCSYLWSHHIPIAQRAGLTLAEIAAIERGEAATDLDRAVLRATEDLNTCAKVSDEAWKDLGNHLDDRQRMDLVFTVGCYALLATAVNTFGVEEEHSDNQDA